MIKYGIESVYLGNINGSKIIPNIHNNTYIKIYMHVKNISFFFKRLIFDLLQILFEDNILYISTELVELKAIPITIIIFARFKAKLNKPTSSIE